MQNTEVSPYTAALPMCCSLENIRVFFSSQTEEKALRLIEQMNCLKFQIPSLIFLYPTSSSFLANFRPIKEKQSKNEGLTEVFFESQVGGLLIAVGPRVAVGEILSVFERQLLVGKTQAKLEI